MFNRKYCFCLILGCASILLGMLIVLGDDLSYTVIFEIWIQSDNENVTETLWQERWRGIDETEGTEKIIIVEGEASMDGIVSTCHEFSRVSHDSDWNYLVNFEAITDATITLTELDRLLGKFNLDEQVLQELDCKAITKDDSGQFDICEINQRFSSDIPPPDGSFLMSFMPIDVKGQIWRNTMSTNNVVQYDISGTNETDYISTHYIREEDTSSTVNLQNVACFSENGFPMSSDSHIVSYTEPNLILLSSNVDLGGVGDYYTNALDETWIPNAMPTFIQRRSFINSQQNCQMTISPHNDDGIYRIDVQDNSVMEAIDDWFGTNTEAIVISQVEPGRFSESGSFDDTIERYRSFLTNDGWEEWQSNINYANRSAFFIFRRSNIDWLVVMQEEIPGSIEILTKEQKPALCGSYEIYSD